VLVPELAAGAAAELDDLRAACRTALGKVAASGSQLVLIGDGPISQIHSPLARGTLHGFGLDTDFHLGSPSCGGAVELPVSLTVGAWLVNEALGPRSGAMGCSVGPDFGASRAAADLLGLAQARDLALVVLGDGSARLSTTAPGYLDERAAGYDDAVAGALSRGDGEALEGLDAELGRELLVAGVPAWQAAGALLAGTAFDAELNFRQAPYGVGYFVATWSRRG
jgi:hypothetical protein